METSYVQLSQPGFEIGSIPEVMPVETVLEPNTTYVIDPSLPIAHDQKHSVNVVAEIVASRDPSALTQDHKEPDSFLVLDVRALPAVGLYKGFGDELMSSAVEYLLVNKDFDWAGNKGLKGIRAGELVTIGRDDPKAKDRFNLNGSTSRQHFSVELDHDGKLTVYDHNSTNGTRVMAGAALAKDRPS